MPYKHLLSKWWLCISVSDLQQILIRLGFPGGSVVKNTPANAGDTEDVGSIPALGRIPGGGNGNPLQDSRLGKSHGQRSLAGYRLWDRRESDMTEWLSKHPHTH